MYDVFMMLGFFILLVIIIGFPCILLGTLAGIETPEYKEYKEKLKQEKEYQEIKELNKWVKNQIK